MKYRLEAHTDDLKLVMRKIDNHYLIAYKLIENESGTELSFDEAARIVAAQKKARQLENRASN